MRKQESNGLDRADLTIEFGRTQLEKRNATVAVVGAGDFIGGEIAKKFAAEGFTVFVGRRQGEKLVPLVKEIEAAGGKVFGRSLDARKEDEMIKFLSDADAHAPLEVCVFNIGANVNFPIVETTERAGMNADPKKFKRFGSARKLYNFHVDNVDAY